MSKIIAPAEQHGLAQALCQSLEDDIVNGLLLPGDRLEEPDLAKRFSVSRTPVREALQLLIATELVEKRPNRGVFVALVTPQRLTAMFEAMAELEATCGRLAALRMSPAGRQSLADLHRAMGMAVRSGDQAVYEAQNRAFHDLIYAAAQSDVLVEVTKQVRRRVSPFRRVQFTALSRLGSSYDEHQGIVDAIARGDSTEAYVFLHRHIMAVHELAQDFLSSLLAKSRKGRTG